MIKLRYIYELDNNTYKNSIDNSINNNVNGDFTFAIDYSQMESIYGESYSAKLHNRFRQRIQEDKWYLILSYYNGKPCGCMWLLIPQKKMEYDSVIIQNNEILICGVYVNPEFRGQRIYNTMHKIAIEYCIKNYTNRKVITIIEKENIASKKSNERIGFKCILLNHLFSICKINLISSVRDIHGKYIYRLFLLRKIINKIILKFNRKI